ncbi:chemotaxis protein CheY [Paucilactobacillus vaccinostercus DSM 20634]|uniref:Chemotaxis protein CheY n=1 Tax=Paucilactobacillus vaccinostercus DSM 20634 TaxID=1423813 RepID=A0A0R2A6E2_9LACO|nr:response regulator transcription factor [Paucilactobacillus vaccinostercus]KRM61938.1 chemotaxis protein CheY [Paucilactobacillus vaccinostercus DSM 20634]
MKIKILIVDDHQILRNGLSLIMQTTQDMEVVGTAADGQEGLDQVKALNPDVVLTDIRMPGMDGITMLKEIRKRNPNLPVVVLTTFDDQKPIQEAMQMGAKGFLLKDAEKETIVKTIRTAFEGRVYIDPALMDKAFAPTMETAKLTDQEHEILMMVADGDRNVDIADKMHLSVRTIKSHLTDIYGKLDVYTRAEAVAEGLRQGIITL